MSSIITGYNYDIFISYRQKDNKGDRWVSEFVEALKTELESTFKEEISVYFDINPHDGLLETHEVGDSLIEKLRCLVFIPIISRTYCDPKSFAWEHEFKAFVEKALQDQFGLKVKLPNGNVASRVLPVRIHDLDIADIKMCEDVLGSLLRGIEFIYKEPGVNRSLTPDDDEKVNLNKTKYRNQINKVALAINEIINGMKTAPEWARLKVRIDTHIENPERKKGKSGNRLNRKPIIIFAVAAILIAVGIFFYPGLFRKDKMGKSGAAGDRLSLAVMPFRNMTNDTTWDVWQDGIQTNLITSLSGNSEGITIREAESVTSLLNYKGFTGYASMTPSIAGKVSLKLDAGLFITGSITQSGQIIRLNSQLVDSKTRDILKSFQINGMPENILSLIDTLSVMVRNFLVITELKKELPAGYVYVSTTNSPEAFRYYIYGKNEYIKYNYPAAQNWLYQATLVDSNFIDAFVLLSNSFGNEFDYEQITRSYGNEFLLQQAKKYCLKAYEKRDRLPVKERILTDWLHAAYFETPNEQIISLKQLINLDDQNPKIHFNLANTYSNLLEYDKAIPEYEKALEIYKKWRIKPYWSLNYSYLCESYLRTGQIEKAKKLYKKAVKDFPDDPLLTYNMAVLLLITGDTIAAKRQIEKGIVLMKNNLSMSDASIAAVIGSGYAASELADKAEDYYRQALSLEPESPVRLNDLAYLLITKNTDVNQGMELIEKALVITPDNFKYLHTKGWGLYMQGRYIEAAEILQKSWDLRREQAVYDHEAFLHLEAAKKAAGI